MRKARGAIGTFLAVCACWAPAAAAVPSPEAFLGHRVGADRRLASWPQVVAYFRVLDDASDRVSMRSAGTSTLGNELQLIVITSEANQRDLERYRGIARRLANPDDLSEQEAADLIATGKAIVLVTCSIHSTEVGSTQMAMELAHDLATTGDAATLGWLDDVILLLMPSINPDGQVMVIDWYNKHLGTEYEGGPMPWLYHPYAGHDNNRDFYMLTQKESQAVNDVLYRDWFPQVFLDEHQMGSTGARMFVPPQTDPVALEIDSMILREADLLGTGMGLRLELAGKTGVGDHMIFDSYWPGGTRNTAWWKNVVGLLTEVASARIATPLYVEPGELAGGAKGLPEYGRRSNYLTPWKGGWWRLRDIVEYELIATRSLLESCSRYRRDLLATFHRLNRDAIEKGRREAPAAFVVPSSQHDPVAAARMIDLLLRHGVRVERAGASFTTPGPAGGSSLYPAGTYVIRTAQPYRAFLLTMLQPQRYPEVVAYVGGPPLPPYDVTSWSLPMSMGVETQRIDAVLDAAAARLARIEAPDWPGAAPARVEAGAGGYLIPHAADSVFTITNRLLSRKASLFWLRAPGTGGGTAPGDVYLPSGQATPQALTDLARELHVPIRPLASPPRGAAWRVRPARVGLYKPWIASLDEGWTRWLLERYEFPFRTVNNEMIQTGTFTRETDVLLLPDVDRSILKEGKPSEEERRSFQPLPPEYSGGLGPEGGERIKRWIMKEGGTVVALDSSADYLIELLDLPVANVLEKVTRDQLNCPGSMLRLLVDPSQPLAYGMRAEEAGWFADSPAFQTRPPDARFDRRVVASYPEYADQILVSGYLKGADLLKKRSAVVDIKAGKGRVVLIGFRAQHRAQPHRTFKMLFNALYLPGLQEASLP